MCGKQGVEFVLRQSRMDGNVLLHYRMFFFIRQQ